MSTDQTNLKDKTISNLTVNNNTVMEMDQHPDNRVVILKEVDLITTINILTSLAIQQGDRINACKTLGSDLLEGDTILQESLTKKSTLDNIITTLHACQARQPKSVTY